MIGAGTVVVKDIKESATYIGVPEKIEKQSGEGQYESVVISK